MVLSFYLIFFSLLAEGNIIDILEQKDSRFTLQKQLKKDIGSVFLNKPALFIQAFESQNFEKALEIWLEDIQETPFAKSPTGSALYSYLLFKNGFEALSLNYLFRNSKPNQINPIVSRLWKVNIDKTKLIWERFYFPLSSDWQMVFYPEIVFKIGSKIPFHLKKNQSYMKSLLALPLSDKMDVFSLEWLFALSLIQKQDMDLATKVLSWLLSQTKDSYRKDKINLTIARLLADIGESEASSHYYKKIKKMSYFWLLAQEEMAWLDLKQANNERAYSTAMALKHPDFSKHLSPSMYFAMALSQIKNCDDEGAVQSLMDFKRAFLDQHRALKKVLDHNLYTDLIRSLLLFYNSKKTDYKIQPAAAHFSYPDSSYEKAQKKTLALDKQKFQAEPFKLNLFYNLKKDKNLKNDISLYSYMKSGKQNKKAKFKQLSSMEDKLIDNLENQIHVRLSFLLNKELKNINEALKKFHLMEAEILYRKYGSPSGLAVSLNSAWFKDISLYKFNGFIYFPFDKNEIWLDELSNYKADKSEACPKGSYIL